MEKLPSHGKKLSGGKKRSRCLGISKGSRQPGGKKPGEKKVGGSRSCMCDINGYKTGFKEKKGEKEGRGGIFLFLQKGVRLLAGGKSSGSQGAASHQTMPSRPVLGPEKAERKDSTVCKQSHGYLGAKGPP